jgi:hypothetical protein
LRNTALVLCRQRPIHLAKSDPRTAQPIEQSILGLKEFDGDPLAAMNPTDRDHRQQREQRWDGTHATSHRTPLLNCWTQSHLSNALDQ